MIVGAVPLLVMSLALALWAGFGYCAARWGGWSTLATYYRATAADHGMRWHFVSARLGPVGYRQCLSLGADSRGIHLSMWLPLRFSHPPLFLPWTEIDDIEPCRRGLRPMLRLQLRRAPGVALELPRHLAIAALGEAHGRMLPPGAAALLAVDAGRGAAIPQPVEST